MLSIGAVEIGDALQRGLDEFVAFLPRLVGFLFIRQIGWLIADELHRRRTDVPVGRPTTTAGA